MSLRRGTKFFHKRILDARKMPYKVAQLCVVTAVRLGVVYYRPDYGLHDDGSPWLGSPAYFPVEEAGRWVLEVKE